MIDAKENIEGIVSVKQNVNGDINKGIEVIEPIVQEKQIEIVENGTLNVTPDEGYDGLSKVEITTSVPEPTLTNLNVTPTTSEQTFNHEGYDGYGNVVVNGVTSNIDNNIQPNNIKKDVEILGVTGTYEAEKEEIPKTGAYFIDYDGTLVDAWDINEIANKTELPANPTHTGLIAQGWNWSLNDIKSYLEKCNDAKIYVGQLYKTTSGLTEIDITLTPLTGLEVTCNMVGNKNWGDGTNNNLTTHTYTNYGDYTITCDGTQIPTGTSSSSGMFGASVDNINAYWCTAIRLSDLVTNLGNYCLKYSKSLKYITISDALKTMGSYVFSYCYSLKRITFSNAMYTNSSNCFSNCYSLTDVEFPSEYMSISGSFFSSCYSLVCFTIPTKALNLGSSIFSNNYSLRNVSLPNTITRIDNSAFSKCYSMIKYDFSKFTTIPTLSSTNVFSDINAICKIVVPDALYSSWKTTTNWSNYADYIYKASEVEE